MSNVDDLPERTTPHYAVYQHEIFLRGAEKGQLPEFSTDPDELEKKAQETPTKGGWLYASSNAGISWTHKANRDAFYQWTIIPRMLVDTNKRDMSCTLKLGTSSWTFDEPFGFAPIGISASLALSLSTRRLAPDSLHLTLGAQFVFLGRPWVYGMSINGEAGVRHVMRSLLADFDIRLNVAGWTSTDEVTSEVRSEGRRYLVRSWAGGGAKL
ncbi:hypothetical protein JCM3775_006831 [Rhodotorula graminis]